MTPNRKQLVDMILDPNLAYDLTASDVEVLQVRAARELFKERREQIPLLARRAEEAGIEHIGRLADLVPLLFAHTVYKSYPPSFVEQGQLGPHAAVAEHAVGGRHHRRGRRGREGRRRLDRAAVGGRPPGARDQRFIGQVLVPESHAWATTT